RQLTSFPTRRSSDLVALKLQPEIHCASTFHVVTIKLQPKSDKNQYIYVLKFHTVKILTQAKDMFVIRPKEVDHSLASYTRHVFFIQILFFIFFRAFQ